MLQKISSSTSAADKEVSLLDLTVAGTKEAINMVESGAQELSEDIMLQALLKGHEAIQELVDFQNYIVAAVGKEKAEVELLQVDADLKVEIETAYYDQLAKAVQVEEKLAREAATQAVKEEVLASYQERFAEDEDKETILRDVAEILEQMEHAEVRRLITEDKVRPDGRRVDEIRPLDAEIDFLPKVHGSGLFTRGQTQALSVLTLAPMSDTQLVDGWIQSIRSVSFTTIISLSIQWVRQGVMVHQVDVRLVTEPWVNVPLLRFSQVLKSSLMLSVW